jgi:hypothetical protein
MQEIGVIILFFCAVIYLVWEIIKLFIPSKNSCGDGCSACSGIDFNAIEKKILLENNGIKPIK